MQDESKMTMLVIRYFFNVIPKYYCLCSEFIKKELKVRKNINT